MRAVAGGWVLGADVFTRCSRLSESPLLSRPVSEERNRTTGVWAKFDRAPRCVRPPLWSEMSRRCVMGSRGVDDPLLVIANIRPDASGRPAIARKPTPSTRLLLPDMVSWIFRKVRQSIPSHMQNQ